MGGRSRIRATGEERALLAVLARSGERGEADRARAVLLSLDGWSSAAIGRALRVRADTARAWRSAFARGGAEALRARPRPGRPGGQGIAALACAGAILADPGRAWRGDLDAAAAQGGDRPARRGRHLDLAPQPAAATKGGFAWRRPRHTLKGRQDRDAVERSGVRLRLLRQQAAAGDIRLLFGDEAEALTHPYLAHAWAKRGADLRIEAPGQARRRALLGVLDHATDRLIVETSATKRSADFVGLLARLDREYAPRPGRPHRPVVLVLDNGPIHTSRATRKALAGRPWLTVEWLPKYAPELNDIERSWRDLKRHHLANRTFRSPGHLDRAIHHAVAQRNRARSEHLWADLRKVA